MKHKRLGNSLDSFTLYYEEMERDVPTNKKVANKKTAKVPAKASKVAVKKPTIKDRINGVVTTVRGRIDNIKKGIVLRKKKAKKLTKAEESAIRQKKIRGIIGIGLLFVVVSIAYSTYMTVLFVDGPVMVVALAPQAVFAALTLLIAFYKIYK